MKKIIVSLALLLAATAALAQPAPVASPRWKPPVANLAALPATGNTIGDTRIALDTMVHYTWDGDSWETAASGGGGGNSFETISTPAGTSPVADSATDTLTLACSGGLTCTGDSSTDTLTLAMGTAATATALAANGANCSAGQFPLGVDASGAVESCSTDISGNAATATTATSASALAANGANCSAGQYPLGVDASGAVESCTADDDQPDSDGEVPDAITVTGSVTQATLTLKQGTTATPTAEGVVEWDTDDDQLAIGDGAATKLFYPGPHAGAATDGGAATTATALAANGANCSAGQYPLGVDASGAVESCTAAATGTIGGSTGATDNSILRADGVGGATLQSSPVTIADTTGDITTPGDVQVANGGWIYFGGTTSSFPGWTNSGTEIRAIRADGVAYVNVGVQTLFANTAVYGGGTTAANASSAIYAGGASLGSSASIKWNGASTTFSSVSYDLGLDRDSAGVLRCTNGSTGICSGFLTARSVEANTAGSGTPNALTATESWRVFTNEGAPAANYHELEPAAQGYNHTWCVQDADGIRITAASGDTIRVIDKVTAAAGYIESTTIGSCVTLIALNGTEWFSHPIGGVWTDGTFTYDDTGNTTP